MFEPTERCRWIEYQPSQTSMLADQTQCTVDMRTGFGVKRNVGGTRPCKIRDDPVGRLHHQANVNCRFDSKVPERLANHRSDRQVGDEVIVHDVEVDDVGTRVEHGLYVVTQSCKVRRQDGRCNQRFHEQSFCCRRCNFNTI